MPFFGIKENLELFLRGASEYPKEALFQKGSRIFSMSTSFDGGLLDHLPYRLGFKNHWGLRTRH
jgi:hypothetical protein